MTKEQQAIIDQVAADVKKTLQPEKGGHGWFHVERVWRNAQRIQASEGGDPFVVELAALLHDVGDYKLHGGEERAEAESRRIMEGQGIPPDVADHVVMIVDHMSFRKSLAGNPDEASLEFGIVQDADRLDGLGAIGIARAFEYGGKHNREMYDPDVSPKLPDSPETYRAAETTTYNHFFDKVLKLRDLFNTETGRKLADARHHYVVKFLEEFLAEMQGGR